MTDLTPSEREIYIREYAALAGLDEDNRRSWAERAVGLERGKKKSGYCAGDRKRGPKPRVPPKGSPELVAEARRLACLACAVEESLVEVDASSYPLGTRSKVAAAVGLQWAALVQALDPTTVGRMLDVEPNWVRCRVARFGKKHPELDAACETIAARLREMLATTRFEAEPSRARALRARVMRTMPAPRGAP